MCRSVYVNIVLPKFEYGGKAGKVKHLATGGALLPSLDSTFDEQNIDWRDALNCHTFTTERPLL